MAWTVVLFPFSGFPRALALKWQTAPRFFIFQYKPPNGELSWQKDTLYTMKKSFLSLVLTLCLFAGSAIAQSSMLATLSHEGEISVFYGANALKEAHTAAAHGDVITLSSGSFNATDITKAITLRGAGVETNTSRNIYPTIITGDFSIALSDSVEQNLTIEGIFNNFTVTIKNGLDNATFIKDRFKTLTYSGSTSSFKNNRFIHCKIVETLTAVSNSRNNSLSFMNCYIGTLLNNDCPTILHNSIMDTNRGVFTLSNQKYCTFYNCIIIAGKNVNGDIFNASNNLYNCITTNLASNNANNKDINYYSYKNITSNSNHSIQNIDGVFKTFRVNGYNEEETFELLDDVKTKYLGTDGTQIGIHGGSYPYSSITTNPQITKCIVAPRSTADGKLSIDIEVKAGE